MSVKTIQVVRNALAVLEAVSRSQPAGLGEVARAVGLDRSAVQRILATLHAEGWIRPDRERGGWLLTGRALTVGAGFAAGDQLRERARTVLREVNRAVAETVWLSVADGDSLIVVDEISSSHALRVTFPIGYTGPLGPDTAGGLAILACSGTPRDPGEAAVEVRRRGYALQANPENPLWAVAVPVPAGGGGAPPAAIVVGVPRDRCDAERLHELGALLRGAVADVFVDS